MNKVYISYGFHNFDKYFVTVNKNLATFDHIANNLFEFLRNQRNNYICLHENGYSATKMCFGNKLNMLIDVVSTFN